MAGDLFGRAVAISGDTAIVGADFDDDAGENSGAAYIFVRSGNSWVEQAKLVPSDAEAGDQFGFAVDITGDTAIIGAWMKADFGRDAFGNGSGAAYIFVRSGNSWTEQDKLFSTAAGDRSGFAVGISGDTAIIGAPGNDDTGLESGLAAIFVRGGGVWVVQGALTTSDPAAGDEFGRAVAINGDTAMVGAPFDDDAGESSGSVYVFVRSGSGWTQQAKLVASDVTPGALFGFSIAISGETAIAGIWPGFSTAFATGGAYIFERSGNSWIEQAKLAASNAGLAMRLTDNQASAGDQFGFSVGISGDLAIVGAFQDSDTAGEAGVAYIFERGGGGWRQQTKLTASDAESGDWFGFSVGVSEDTAVVGALSDFNGGLKSGSAYVHPLSTEIDIPDLNLRAVLEEALGKNPGDPITADNLATLIDLSAVERNIVDLTGLEHATNLTNLRLDFNQISDVSPLARLTNLISLRLSVNQISDVSPLAGLTNLTDLYLDSNQISDVNPLVGLTNLTDLYLDSNQISDLSPLAGLTNLRALLLYSNQISDVSPLVELTNLTNLFLDRNQISDLSPLSGLINLTHLDLSSNQITDITPLVRNTGIAAVDFVDLLDNPLSTIAVNTHIPALQARGVDVLFDVLAVNRPPEWTQPPIDRTVHENQLITFTIEATDADGDHLTYAASDLPTGATFDPGLRRFAWQPTFDQRGQSSLPGSQTYPVMFIVTDSPKDGQTATTVTIAVNNRNRKPQFNPIGDKPVQAGSQLTFTVSAIDPDEDALTYSVLGLPEGATFDRGTGQFSWMPTQEQGGQIYAVIFQATDLGELSELQRVQIPVSTAAIPLQITAPTANQVFVVDENHPLEIDVKATGGTPPYTYSATNPSTGATFDSGMGKFSWTPTYNQGAAPARNYSLMFTVTDGAGETVSVPITIRVIDVNRPPEWTQPPRDQTVDENGQLTFSVSATDPDGDGLAYATSDLPTGARFNSTTRTFAWRPSFDQGGQSSLPENLTYRVTFIVTDAPRDGRTTTTIAIIVNNVNRKPQFNPIGDKPVQADNQLGFTVSAIDPDGDVLTYSASDLPTGASFDSGTRQFSWTPTQEQGDQTYTVTFQATDPGGVSETQAVQIPVSKVAIPLQIAAPTANQVFKIPESQPLEIAIEATGGTPPYTYSVTNQPAGATFASATGQFSWTPAFNQGAEPARSYSLTFTVADGAGQTVSVIITISVTDVNRPPEWTQQPTDQTIDEDGQLTFTVIATDADGETLTYSTSELPAGANFDSATQTFSWQPSFGQGGQSSLPGGQTYPVTFTVTDAPKDGEITTPITITVNNVNRQPQFDSINNQTLQAEELLTFTVSAADPDGDTLIYSSANTLTGAIFDLGTRQFSFTPTQEQGGQTYTVTFQATDLGGLSNTQNVQIEVRPVVSPLQITAPTDNQAFEVDENTALTINVIVTGGAPPFNYSGENQPTGSNLNSTTGEFSWTPTHDQGGEPQRAYSLTFTVTDAANQADSVGITIQVKDVNRPPVLDDVPAQTFTEKNPITFTLNATDPDGDTLTFSVTPQLSGASFNPGTGVFNWTPDIGQAGDQRLTFRAEDGKGGSDTKEALLQIAVLDTEAPRGTVDFTVGNEIKQIGTAQTLPLTLTLSDNNTAPSQIKVELRNRGGNWTPQEAFQVPAGDGEKTIEIRFTDEVGNRSDPVQVAFILDTTPPQISHTPVASANLGSNASIEVNVTDVSPITGRVQYRPGGDSNFTTLEMTGDKSLKAEIPAASLKFGVSYYVEVEDALGHKSTHPQGGEQAPIGITASGEFTPDTPFTHDAWNLFSVPLSEVSTNLTTLLDSAAGPNDWKAGTWNGTANTPSSPIAAPGKPFWLIARKPLNPPQLKISGKTAKPEAPHTIRLPQGWNLIANPFLFPVAFGNLRVETAGNRLPLDQQNAVRPRFWSWKDTTSDDRTDGVYDLSTDFSAVWEPWSGYWIFTNAEATLHLEPFTELVKGVPAAPPQPPLNWLATLSIGNARGVSRVQFALSKAAQWGYDPLDIEQPPSPASISLSLLQDGMRYQRVALPLDAEQWAWEAELNVDQGATLVLSDTPPSGHHLYLERLADSSRIELLHGQSIPASDGHHRLRIRLTKRTLGWDVLDAVPGVTQLLPNYPNPFNPETWIPFTLSKAGSVEISIYDAVGRHVRRLSLGMLPPGRYSEQARAAYFDGRNETGESVASGAYFVVLKTKGYQKARRIVLLK